ncbi:MAG: hypothetical protein C0402_12320 [Thermodesulfovibrio sp.]|nr:hypothetical protein [Thermodesulfovibrio sp.]
MKLRSLILLIVLCLSLASPLTIHLASAGQEEHLVTLDVCHTSDASLSVNADSPALFEAPCNPLAPEYAGTHEAGSTVFTPYVSSLQQERPPQV